MAVAFVVYCSRAVLTERGRRADAVEGGDAADRALVGAERPGVRSWFGGTGDPVVRGQTNVRPVVRVAKHRPPGRSGDGDAAPAAHCDGCDEQILLLDSGWHVEDEVGLLARGARRRREPVRHGRVDDVGERQVCVVELQREEPAEVALLEVPAQAVGRDVLALLVEDAHRVHRDRGDLVPGRVEEGEAAVGSQAGVEPRRELPAPGLLALPFDDREELLRPASVDDDRLRAELGLTRGAVDVPPPLGAADVLRGDRERDAPVRDGVALVVDADADAGGGRAVERSPRLLGAELLLEEAGDARVQTADAGKDDDREEDRRGACDGRCRPHRGRAAQNDGGLDVSRARLRGPHGGDGGHLVSGARNWSVLERIGSGGRPAAAIRYENGMRPAQAPVRVREPSPKCGATSVST